MSIANEISRLQAAKADIKAAIEAKGVTVPAAAKLDTYDDYVAQISCPSVARASEMQSINVAPGPDGKWSALTGGLRAMSLLLSAGTYTIIAPSCSCVFAVVNSIGAANEQISFSPDYPSRFLTRNFAETTITGQAGKYLVIRADTGANANPAISPTIIFEP